MSYTLDKLPDEPIITLILNEDHSFIREGEQALTDMLALLETQHEPVHLIFDVSVVSFSFEDILQGGGTASKQQQFFHHPKVAQTIIVAGNRLVKLAAQGLNSATFGSLNIKAVDSLNAALSYARTQAAAKRR